MCSQKSWNKPCLRDKQFLSLLLILMECDRYDHPSICGRDQLGFRSYYYPVKDVIDGDLCETFITLDPATQKKIADELDRTPGEVAKKLEDMRNRLL